jgi:hypothetical protein
VSILDEKSVPFSLRFIPQNWQELQNQTIFQLLEAFLTLHPTMYSKTLIGKNERTGKSLFEVNTGWNGTGKRISLKKHQNHYRCNHEQ